MAELEKIITKLNESNSSPVSLLIDTNIFMYDSITNLVDEITTISDNRSLRFSVGTLCEVIAELYNLMVYGKASYSERKYRLPSFNKNSDVQVCAKKGLEYYGYLNGRKLVNIFNSRFQDDPIKPDTFADEAILSYAMNQRSKKKNTIVITNDRKLAFDILNSINNLTSTKGTNIMVYSMNESNDYKLCKYSLAELKKYLNK